MKGLAGFRWAMLVFVLTSAVVVAVSLRSLLAAGLFEDPAASAAFTLAAVSAAIFGTCLTLGLIVLAVRVAGFALHGLQKGDFNDALWEGAAWSLLWLSASSWALMLSIQLFPTLAAPSGDEVELFLAGMQTRSRWLVYGAAVCGGCHAVWLLRKRGCDWLDASIAVSTGALAIALVAGAAQLIS